MSYKSNKIRRETLRAKLRQLVEAMYYDLKGAYGAHDGRGYEGEYNRQIDELVDAIIPEELD